MNRPETPDRADPDGVPMRRPAESTDLLEQYLGGAADDVLFGTDIAFEEASDTSQGEEIREQEPPETTAPADPKATMSAQVGAYFAAEINHAPDMALRAAGRLGPKRVLSLLT